MARASLRASEKGIRQAKQAFNRTELTQEELAAEIGLKTRYSVGKFFKGESIERHIFREICFRLDLDWEEIAVPDDASEIESDRGTDINLLVQEVREKIRSSIQERCGTMRVLDMSQPIGLGDIYTRVNILEKISKNRHLEIADLLKNCTPENFDRFGLGKVFEQRVPGIEAVKRYPKLMVLGKPGSGKTTFLKYLAIQCNGSEFQIHLVPIFITLKDFAEAEGCPSLLAYIIQLFSPCGVAADRVEQLLSYGRAMILLDGLDEVQAADNSRILKQIRDFSDLFCTNQFAIACRIAAQEYIFEKFTEVEIADFDNQQIDCFAKKWFKAKEINPTLSILSPPAKIQAFPQISDELGKVKAEKFMQKLAENQTIKELATNPLLLTLLCLVFEETADFPLNRSQLYKEGIDILLKKWDAKRNIERERVYKKLSVQRKEDLLSKIALLTFERGNYFFKQKEIEHYIAEYIRHLPDAKTDPETLQLDSEAVLKSIEAQHGLLVERARGIYSFSHLTFQEYFTAREIVANANPELWQKLANHLTNPRWREIFLLATGTMQNADSLLRLIKQTIDGLIAEDETLQQFLTWGHQKSLSVQVPYKLAAVRAFYLALVPSRASVRDDLNLDLDLTLALDRTFSCASSRLLELDYCLILALARALVPTLTRDLSLTLSLARATARVLALHNILDPDLELALQHLTDRLPGSNENAETKKEWWQVNGQAWTEQLRFAIVTHRSIGHNWQFSDKQKESIVQYYKANQLLVDCLNGDCYVSREVRQEIEDTLLLPIAEIHQQKR